MYNVFPLVLYLTEAPSFASATCTSFYFTFLQIVQRELSGTFDALISLHVRIKEIATKKRNAEQEEER